MYNNFTAIILAGGKSSRIGSDKALLKLDNEFIIERIYNLLSENFQKIFIISNHVEKFIFLTKNVFKDIYPNFGPLSGIHSGLINSQTEDNFIISCDMPLVTKEVINFIISSNSSSDIILPKSEGKVHSLCGIYKKSCLSKAEQLLRIASLDKNNLSGKSKIKLFDLINSVKSNFLDISNEKFYKDKLMFNMNTMEDYLKVKEILYA